jgi:16S rRNA (uracil1498-N3)-methyltransferase
MTPRFFYAGPLTLFDSVVLSESASFHATRVLRLTDASTVVLFNGDGYPYSCTVQIQGKKVLATIIAQGPADPKPLRPRVLAQAVLSNEKMAWVIEKAIELGVDRIVPITTQSAKVRLDPERGQSKQARWQDIAVSACAQCGRNTLVQIDAPCSLAAFLSTDSAATTVMFEPGDFPTLAQILPAMAIQTEQALRILVGPESGFSREEVAYVQARSAVTASLGWRVLRTETAGLAALAIIESQFALASHRKTE